jgi:hypothetical protein
VHGITDDQVRDAPSFGDVLPHLTAALAGKRVLIYNRGFDVGRLRHELTLHYRQAGHDDPKASAQAWLDAVRFEDVMIPYSTWYGDWSDCWGEYTWQPLPNGNHRALGDCRALLEGLKEMAESGRPDPGARQFVLLLRLVLADRAEEVRQGGGQPCSSVALALPVEQGAAGGDLVLVLQTQRHRVPEVDREGRLQAPWLGFAADIAQADPPPAPLPMSRPG